MPEKNYFDSKYVIDFYDLTQYEEASPMTMLRLLQETAGDHHFPVGENIIDLYRKNLGWVLLSGAMQFDRYPKYKEQVTIRTWMSKYKSIRGQRENLVLDSNGEIIGRAKGLWLFFDVEKRRPVSIPDKFKEIWGSDPEESIDYDIKKDIPVLNDGEFMDVIKVKKFDIDTNKHVNNIRYFQWLIEVIPDRVMRNNFLHTIHGKFLHEANYGDQLLIYTKIIEMDKEFLHTIFDLTTNKVCVAARTYWKAR